MAGVGGRVVQCFGYNSERTCCTRLKPTSGVQTWAAYKAAQLVIRGNTRRYVEQCLHSDLDDLMLTKPGQAKP